MSTKFAAGKRAHGLCDRCGCRSLLAAMKTESVAGKVTNTLVCETCWDSDHPQNFQGRYPVSDPQALQNPRPDPALAASR